MLPLIQVMTMFYQLWSAPVMPIQEYTPVVFAVGEYCYIDSQVLVNIYKSTFTIQLIYHCVNYYYMWVNY